ncbi:Glutamyl/glutaminyl-tRNA synthetase, class Ic, catalytic domain protein [Flammeovirgaceae bacterium 311]|nr:Glutamyl/glutaminyl-tRNA synthetase, class Ic, catalytic domain protein [Flammeovirgaceae bacterium 311]
MGAGSNNQEVPVLKSRIAPTPSGYLHRGNAFSFVLTWLLVRSAGGELLLRIDDADSARVRPEYIQDVFRCLDWLGLDWDEGPESPADFTKSHSQQHRFDHYNTLLEVLKDNGYLYACDCSRSQVRMHSKNGIYQGSCRELELSFNTKGAAWRIKVPEGNICFQEAGQEERCLPLSQEMGDFVVRRREGLAAYQIASLADDIDHRISLIVRGKDLLYSSAAQVFIASCLANQTKHIELQQKAILFQKASFLHHPLLLNEKGEKLAKSAGSTSIKSLREAGGNPLPIYALVAEFLSLPADAAASLDSLLKAVRQTKVLETLFMTGS